MEVTKHDSQRSEGAGGSVLRWLLLAAVIATACWFGIKALREAPEAGAEGAPAAVGGAPPQMPPATVIVAEVESVQAQERRRVIGSLRALSRAEVAARETGAVETVLVEEGQTVSEGEIVARIDPRRIEAEMGQAEARLTAAEAGVIRRKAEAERARSDLQRKKELYEEKDDSGQPLGALSERELLDAQREAAVAEALQRIAEDELAAETSAVELLKVRKTDLEIRAPFAGRVVRREVEPGEWLAAGSPVMTLISAGEIEAWLQVPERYVAGVTEAGTDIRIVTDGGGFEAEAKSVRTIGDIDGRTRLFPVVVTIDDAEGTLVPGMSVHAELPVGERAERLAVPVDAIVVTRSEAYVYRAGNLPEDAGENALPPAEKVVVTERFRSNGIAYLESEDLRPGDQVVVEGNERLLPGTPLLLAPVP